MSTEQSPNSDEQTTTIAEQLSEEDRQAIAEIVLEDLTEDVANSSSRRDVLKALGLGGAAAALGFGGTQAAVKGSTEPAAAAQASGSVGTPSDPVDVYANSVDTGQVNNEAIVTAGDDVQAKYDSLGSGGVLYISEEVEIDNPINFDQDGRSVVYSDRMVATNDATMVRITGQTQIVNLNGPKQPQFVADRDSIISTSGNHGVHASDIVETTGKVAVNGPNGGNGSDTHGWYFENDDSNTMNYVTGRFVAVFTDGDGIRVEHTGTGGTNLNAWDVHLEARGVEGVGVNLIDGVRGSAWVDTESNTGRGLNVGPNCNQWIIRGCYSENNGAPPRLEGDRCVGWVLNSNEGSGPVATGAASSWWKGPALSEGNFIVGGVTMEPNSITSLADTATAQALPTAEPVGKITVIRSGNGTFAEFYSTGASVVKGQDPNGDYTTTAGNDTTTNVYHDGSAVVVENQEGGSASYEVLGWTV